MPSPQCLLLPAFGSFRLCRLRGPPPRRWRHISRETLAAPSYEITAVRSTRRGNPAQFNLNLGVGCVAFVTVTPVNAKLAA